MNNSQQYVPSPRLWNIRTWRGFLDNRAVLAQILPLEILGWMCVHVCSWLIFTRTIAQNLYMVVKFSFHSTLTSHKLHHLTESKQNQFSLKAYLQIKHELWILNQPHFSQCWCWIRNKVSVGESKRARRTYSDEKEQNGMRKK